MGGKRSFEEKIGWAWDTYGRRSWWMARNIQGLQGVQGMLFSEILNEY